MKTFSPADLPLRACTVRVVGQGRVEVREQEETTEK
jgi:hypothetical protein